MFSYPKGYVFSNLFRCSANLSFKLFIDYLFTIKQIFQSGMTEKYESLVKRYLASKSKSYTVNASSKYVPTRYTKTKQN